MSPASVSVLFHYTASAILCAPIQKTFAGPHLCSEWSCLSSSPQKTYFFLTGFIKRKNKPAQWKSDWTMPAFTSQNDCFSFTAWKSHIHNTFPITGKKNKTMQLIVFLVHIISNSFVCTSVWLSLFLTKHEKAWTKLLEMATTVSVELYCTFAADPVISYLTWMAVWGRTSPSQVQLLWAAP